MPFVFYIFDAEACKAYPKAAVPLCPCTMSGCDIAAPGGVVVEVRAGLWAASWAAAQPRWPLLAWQAWPGQYYLLFDQDLLLPPTSLPSQCSSVTFWGLVHLWNIYQSYAAALHQEISHFAAKQSGQTRSHWCTWSMIFYKSTVLSLNVFFRNFHFFFHFSLHLKCKLRSEDHFPTGRAHCIVTLKCPPQ